MDKAYKTLHNACKRVGFPNLHHHDLRKFFATRCALKGFTPAVVGAWLGHKDGGYLANTVYTKVPDATLMQLGRDLHFGPAAAADNVVSLPQSTEGKAKTG